MSAVKLMFEGLELLFCSVELLSMDISVELLSMDILCWELWFYSLLKCYSCWLTDYFLIVICCMVYVEKSVIIWHWD